MTPDDPARRYQDVIGELTVAAEALRARDRARAAELSRELVERDTAMVAAQERAALSRLVVELRWEQVIEALWPESWMTLRLRPRPDLTADPARLDELDDAVEAAADEVLAAVRRRILGLGGR